MRPTLFSFHLGGESIGIHTYGLAVAVGLAVGLILAVKGAMREGLPRARFLDLSFWMVACGVLAARVVYVALNAKGFALACRGADDMPRPFGRVLYDCTYALRFWEGGLVFYGGVLGAAGVLVHFSRKEGWRLGHLADLFTPGLPLGHALGRLGCFAAGCCFGKPAAVPWAVAFPPESVAFRDLAVEGMVSLETGRTVPLHPTQLYESLAELAIFVVLMVARRRTGRRRDQVRDGHLFALYLLLYAPTRFVLEIFRGDAARRFVWPVLTPHLAGALGLPPQEPLILSVSQTVSLVLIAAVACWKSGLLGRGTPPSPPRDLSA